MKPAEIRTFFEYHYWAFERIWECVMQLTDEQDMLFFLVEASASQTQ